MTQDNFFAKWQRIFKILFSTSLYREIVRLVMFYYYEHALPMERIRKFKDADIHPTAQFRFQENIILEENVMIGASCCVWASKGSTIRIGKNSGIAYGTMVVSSNHMFSSDTCYRDQPMEEKDLVIGNNVWIGSNCVVLAGVTIGQGSIIGAGTIISKDIPEFSIVVGKSRDLTVFKRR